MTQKIVATRLKQARLQKKLTQIEVSTLTGINNKTLSGYENGVSQPDLETLKVLATLYGITTDFLIGNESPSSSETTPSKRDRLQLEELLESENLVFKGAPLSEEDRKKIKHALELAFWDAKEKNKRK